MSTHNICFSWRNQKNCICSELFGSLDLITQLVKGHNSKYYRNITCYLSSHKTYKIFGVVRFMAQDTSVRFSAILTIKTTFVPSSFTFLHIKPLPLKEKNLLSNSFLLE